MEVKIYGLYDERTPDIIRYIGKTKMNLKKRLQGHIDEARNGKYHTYKNHWIQKLLNEGVRPSIKVLETCNEDIWQEREKEWIANLTNLTNSTEGGEVIGHKLVPILQYSKFGKFIKEYESLLDACKEYGFERHIINSALQRNPKGGYGGGYLWRYSLYGKVKFLPPYINPRNTPIRIIDIDEEQSYLFESLEEGLEFFKLFLCGNIHRCIESKIPYKNKYFIMRLN